MLFYASCYSWLILICSNPFLIEHYSRESVSAVLIVFTMIICNECFCQRFFSLFINQICRRGKAQTVNIHFQGMYICMFYIHTYIKVFIKRSERGCVYNFYNLSGVARSTTHQNTTKRIGRHINVTTDDVIDAHFSLLLAHRREKLLERN